VRTVEVVSGAHPKDSSLAARVITLRKIAGLKQNELSVRCGFARPYVGLIEHRRRTELGISVLVSLAAVLGVSLDYLVLGRGKRPADAKVRAAVERAKDPIATKKLIEHAIGAAKQRAPRGARASHRSLEARPT
jgi:transcriptional regulator with XRE-family HTH domain